MHTRVTAVCDFKNLCVEMRYFITVTLSRHDVTLKYYRDDDGINRLLPFQGIQWPAPLAVHIGDDGVIAGKDALDRFEVSQPNTFYNLFSLINSGDTYTRFGLHKPTSHLIYLAVEAFLEQVLPHQLGITLSDTRRSLPVAFNFTADVSTTDRRHLLDLFTKGDGEDCGGYGNVGVIDADSQLASLALKSNHRNYALVLHTSRQDLAVTLYSKSDPSKCIGAAVMKDLGVDRRIMNGVKEIKEYVSSSNPNIDFSPIEERLEKIVEDFIASGKMEMKSKVMINGENYRFFLSVDDLRNNAAAAERQFIAQHLRQFLHNNSVHPDDTVMVLASPKLQNDYFQPLFREYFESVYCVTEQQSELMQQQIIDSIVTSDYNFSEEVSQLNTLREQWAQMTTYTQNIRIPAGQYAEALDDVSEFKSTVRMSDISAMGKEKLIADAERLADRLRDLLAEQKRKAQQPPVHEMTSQGNTTLGMSTPPDYFTQLIESVTEEINQFAGYGDLQSARNSYNDLLTELRNAGKDADYAAVLQHLKRICYPEIKREQHPDVTTAKSSRSPLETAIAQREFRQARKICKENDDFDNYQTMKELEDAHKKFVVAGKFFEQYVAEHNANAIARAIRELTEYARLLDAVKSPHPEVDTLLSRYKQVK